MRSISMTIDIKNAIIEHATSELPNECCGYITGKKDDCLTVHKMTNCEASPTYFEFDPKEQFQVVKAARQCGEVPLVVYHSHPESPARLSQKDLELLTDPNMVYVIVSLKESVPEIKAYQIVDRHVFDVSITIIGD
jgi:proteasome lid subunit RPN8/RPN11